MHLADGIVSQTPLVLALNVAGGLGALYCVARAGREPSRLPWVGTLSAVVLAAQAVNVPLVPGASAHAIGTGLLTALLGPATAIAAMVGVLLIQALLWADGGLLVLGINALTMAIVPALAFAAVTRAFGRGAPSGVPVVLGTALGSLLGAAVLTLVLVQAAHAPAALTAKWLLGVQVIAGVVEGALTSAALGRLAERSPSLLPVTAPVAPRTFALAACALAVLLLMVPFASDVPDALQVALNEWQRTR